jgi:hypothetical protein
MTPDPLVSIVIPTYNRTHFLRTAIASALGQSFRNIEVIVADDASTTDVRSAITDLVADPRVSYRRNATNLGMGGNTWSSLAAASGKYVATIHDDDAWEPEFLTTLIPPLERDDSLSVAFSNHHIMDERGVLDDAAAEQNTRHWRRDRLAAGVIRPFTEEAIVWQAVPAAMAAVFRKAAIDWSDFPAAVGTYYDVWLGYLAARRGAGAYYDPRRLTRYRVHAQSETGSWASAAGRVKALRQSEFMLGRCLEDPELANLRPKLRSIYVRRVISLALAVVETGALAEAKTLLRGARRRAPSMALTAAGLLTALPPPASRELVTAARRLWQSRTGAPR